MVALAYKAENNTIRLRIIQRFYKYIINFKANLRNVLLYCNKWAQ